MQKIAAAHPETRAECLGHLISVLEKYQENDEGLNGFIIADLVDLQDTEHLDLIEKAFAEDRVDEMIMGDFEDVQIELGLREERSQPRTPLFPPFGRAISQEPRFPAEAKPLKEKKKEKDKRKQEKKSRKKNRKRK